MLQAPRPRVHIGRSKGRVVGLHHQVAAEATGARGSVGAISAVGQLKMRHPITDAQCRVWVEGYGGDLKNLIPETGSVKCLLRADRDIS